jgi:hypothetical protein
MTELDKLIGDKNTSPLAGILRIVPIERMNAVMGSRRRQRTDEVKKWSTARQGWRTAAACSSRLQPVNSARKRPAAAAAPGRARSRRLPRRRSRPARPPHGQSADVHADESDHGQQRAAAPAGDPDADERRFGNGIRHRNLQVVADKVNTR